jgi:hypothetical protein
MLKFLAPLASWLGLCLLWNKKHTQDTDKRRTGSFTIVSVTLTTMEINGAI